MTWGRLQALVEALLAGDRVLTADIEGRLALLEYAYEEITNLSEVLSLEGNDQTDIVRQSVKDLTVSRPELPADNTSILPVDKGLVFAVARLMASYVSNEKFQIHRNQAIQLIERYNSKVYSARDGNNEYK
jgi:hypothetical protein